MFKSNDFQMFLMTNPEATLRALRLALLIAMMAAALLAPTVAFAQPVGGDVGT